MSHLSHYPKRVTNFQAPKRAFDELRRRGSESSVKTHGAKTAPTMPSVRNSFRSRSAQHANIQSVVRKKQPEDVAGREGRPRGPSDKRRQRLLQVTRVARFINSCLVRKIKKSFVFQSRVLPVHHRNRSHHLADKVQIEI